MTTTRFSEFAADAGWLVVIVLLLPLLIPLGVLAVLFVLQERLYGGRRRRMRSAAARRERVDA
jgi:hypothetical protein